MSLRRNFSWSLAGNFLYSACQLGWTIAIARVAGLALDIPDTRPMLGLFTLGLAIATPTMLFTNLALRLNQATDTRGHYTFRDYFGLRVCMTALALAFITVVAFSMREASADHAMAHGWQVILVIGIAKGFESLSDIVYGLLQQHERMDRVSQSMMLRGPLSLLALTCGLVVTRSMLGGAIGLALAWGLVFVIFDVRSAAWILRQQHATGSEDARRHLWPRFHLRTLAGLAAQSLPFGIAMVLTSLNTNIPRYFIEHTMGLPALGEYAAMAMFIVAGGTAMTALGQSAAPRLAKYYAFGPRRAFVSLLGKLVILGIVMGVAGWVIVSVAGRPLLLFLFGPGYTNEFGVFQCLMVVALVTYVAGFLNYGMTATRSFRQQMLLFCVVTPAIALACWAWVPRFGMLGAAYALLAGALVQVLGSAWIILGALKRPIEADAASIAAHAGAAADRGDDRCAVWQAIRADIRAYGSGGIGKLALLCLCNTAFKALVNYRFARACYTRRWHLLAHWITYRSKVKYGCELSPAAQIAPGIRLVHGLATVIGAGARVGVGCTIYQGVTLGMGKSAPDGRAYPIVEPGVCIYAGARVLGGITIGEASVIGANAVVLADVPAGSVAVGVPARVLRPPASAGTEGAD